LIKLINKGVETMEKSEIISKLTTIFRTVFENNSLMLTDKLTSKDVKGWDSLTHMHLITAIENEYSIKFKLKELNKMKNIGDMIEIITSKV
jgi:acyl carrier protein